MRNEAITQAEADEEVLSYDISDEGLERAANTEQNGFTMFYYTNNWNSCDFKD